MILYILTTVFTLVRVDRVVSNFERYPWGAIVLLINVLAVANIPRATLYRRTGEAFLSSCVTIVALVCLFSMALWPNLLTSSLHPQNSLTIANSASSEKTLGIMLIVAALGMPLVLTYTIVVYWTFRGKVQLDPQGY